MGFLAGLGISLVAGVIGGLMAGNASNESDRQQAELIQQQLEQQKKQNRDASLDTASSQTMSNEVTAQALDENIKAYNSQINSYTTQAVQAVGTAQAKAGQTGFRNTGSNTNVVKNQETSNGYNLSYLSANLSNSLISNGASAMANQSETFSRLSGYNLNIQQATQTANLKLSQLGVEDNYWGSSRMWSDALTSSITSGLGYLGSQSGNISKNFSNWWNKKHSTATTGVSV